MLVGEGGGNTLRTYKIYVYDVYGPPMYIWTPDGQIPWSTLGGAGFQKCLPE